MPREHNIIVKTAPGALKLLWKEKAFIKPMDVKTIAGELEKRGYNFSDKGLMMALRSAFFLTRKGNRGHYQYVQKHPYTREEYNDK